MKVLFTWVISNYSDLVSFYYGFQPAIYARPGIESSGIAGTYSRKGVEAGREAFLAGLPEGSLEWLTQTLVPAGSWQGARLARAPALPALLT